MSNKTIADRAQTNDEFTYPLSSNYAPVKNKHEIFTDIIQEELIKIASHEMKTPVQSILTYAELLHSKPIENHEEYVKAIYRNALRLQKLSKNLLDVTSIEHQSFYLKKEKFDLNEIISSIIQDILTQTQNYGTKNKRIFFIPRESIFVYADKDRISQVLTNLIDNALKFTHDGQIIIKARLRDNMAAVSVKDAGIGINQNIFPYLFSKFFTYSYNGTGLGLYISKNIVMAHDGKIWAKNNAYGGATFCFEIPANLNEKIP